MEVSYIICNYNYGEWIGDAIDSVLNQTIPCNLCVVDDRSTDISITIIQDKLDKYISHETSWQDIGRVWDGHLNNKKIIYIDKDENTGPSDSRNVGIEECLEFTDVFAILDADDIAHPEKTEKLLPYFDDPTIGVVYADYETLNVDNGFKTKVYKPSFDYERLFQENMVHSGAFIRKEALLSVKDENGYYDKTLRVSEDLDLWLRIGRKYNIVHHPECLTTARVSQQNSTNSISPAIWQRCWQKIGDKLRA